MRWEKVKLGEIIKVKSGVNLTQENMDLNGIYPVYGGNGITGQHSTYNVDQSTLVIGRVGYYCGSIHLTEGKAWITDNAFIVSFPEEVFNKKYLYYTLKNLNLRKYSNSSAQPVISGTGISKVVITFPPLHIQEQIADTLDKADALRKKDQELLTKYDELAQAIFYQMFGDPANTYDAEYKPLSFLCQVNPKKSELDLDEDIQVSFIPMEDADEKGNLNPKKVRRYSEVSKGFTYFREGDVLFAKITPCMENGKGGIAYKLENKIGFGSTEFHVIRPSSKLSAEYINTLLSLKTVRKKAEKNMTGSAGQKRVPRNFFDQIMIKEPSIEVLEQFTSKYKNIKIQRKLSEDLIIASETIFQSLLVKFFS